MAFAGLNSALVQIDDDDAVAGSANQLIITKVISSEVTATTVAGTLVGPAKAKSGEPKTYWMLRAAADGYVAFGSTPNSAQSPRLALTANKDYFVLAREGHKVMFTAA